MTKSVAMIGVGAMGAPMARRLLSGGFELTVCDRNDAATRPFAERGARVVSTASGCSASDVVLIMVHTGDQVADVLLGEDGIASGLSAGHSPIVSVMSTVSPELITELAARVRALGVRLIDAPVSGGALRAEEGTLTLIMGGEADDIEAAGPVWDSLAKRRFHCGPVGAAQTVKLINNIVCDANVLITGEAYRLALENGLKLRDATRVFDVSTGRNYLSEHPGEAASTYAAFVTTREDFDAVTTTIRKDVDLALDLADASPGAYPVLAHLRAVLDAIGPETFDNWRSIGAARDE
jgi:3-hydroxyisobutyrate dehydrogenase-like beta-hydroxyacid dehydrogenase